MAAALTPRQCELLSLAAAGLTQREMAARLGLHLRSVKSHLEEIHGRLGARNTTQAVVQALRAGLIGYPEEGDGED